MPKQFHNPFSIHTARRQLPASGVFYDPAPALLFRFAAQEGATPDDELHETVNRNATLKN